MRSYIAEIPDGTYARRGLVRQRRRGRRAAARAAGAHGAGSATCISTSPAPRRRARGPMNISDGTTKSMCLVALKHVFPEVPVNGGAFRPARFTIPAGPSWRPSIRPRSAAPRTWCSAWWTWCSARWRRRSRPWCRRPVRHHRRRHRVRPHPDTGGYYVAVYPYPGGYGGSRASDGLVNGTPPGSMAKFMSVEMSEHRYPLRFDHYAIREDSGGAGRHRGGCGSAYGITALGDCVVSILGDRVDHRPPGIAGRRPGRGQRRAPACGGQDWEPPFRSKAERIPLEAGDGVRLASPGGGGYGDPLTREPGRGAADLNAGLHRPCHGRAGLRRRGGGGAAGGRPHPLHAGRSRHAPAAGGVRPRLTREGAATRRRGRRRRSPASCGRAAGAGAPPCGRPGRWRHGPGSPAGRRRPPPAARRRHPRRSA